MACVSLSMLHGFASVTHKGDQVVSCVAINILMIGLTTALAAAWFGQAGLTPTLTNDQRFLEITLPFADIGLMKYDDKISEKVLAFSYSQNALKLPSPNLNHLDKQKDFFKYMPLYHCLLYTSPSPRD